MGKYWDETKLDAYGHLEWTVGNEDWMACFDAILSPSRQEILYHIVVNCESGGFVDTMETGSMPIEQAVQSLEGLPDYWVGVCYEHYAGEDTESEDSPYRISDKETVKTAASWKRHLEDLVKTARELGPAEPDEIEEPFDPIRDGWVGRDGRP